MSTQLSYEILIAAQRAALTSLRAQAEQRRVQHDSAIAAKWAAGMPCARIAGQLGLSTTFVYDRVKALGLPKRPHGFRACHAGMSPAQMETYRLYRRNQYPAAEARSLALGEAR